MLRNFFYSIFLLFTHPVIMVCLRSQGSRWKRKTNIFIQNPPWKKKGLFSFSTCYLSALQKKINSFSTLGLCVRKKKWNIWNCAFVWKKKFTYIFHCTEKKPATNESNWDVEKHDYDDFFYLCQWRWWRCDTTNLASLFM